MLHNWQWSHPYTTENLLNNYHQEKILDMLFPVDIYIQQKYFTSLIKETWDPRVDVHSVKIVEFKSLRNSGVRRLI